jgi:hypothetical protein
MMSSQSAFSAGALGTTFRSEVNKMTGIRTVRLLLALTFVGSACGDSTSPEVSVSGRWLGTITSGGATATFNLTLAQTGTSVTGNGTIVTSLESVALSASGTFVTPNLSLTISAQGYEQMNYSGRLVTDIQIDGTLNGSGFNNHVVNIVRQP